MAEQTISHLHHHLNQNQQQQNAVKIEMESVPNGNGSASLNESVAVHNTSSNAINRDFEFDFLPYIYEVIKSIEREPVQDCAGKSRENQDTSAKVLELEKKLNEARQQILLLPGIEHSREDQLKQLELCRQQVELKQQLIQKYRNFCTFNLTD